MIFIVCQRVILTDLSGTSEMVARLRGHDRLFCHVQSINKKNDDTLKQFDAIMDTSKRPFKY